MGLDYALLWDEQGQLRRGCTVREALDRLIKFGSHSAGENVCVNGVSYKLSSLLYGPDRPAVADKPVSRVYDGYYHQLNFNV